jgi:hypothetical protein
MENTKHNNYATVLSAQLAFQAADQSGEMGCIR